MSGIREYSFSSLYDISSGISTTKAQAGHGSPFASFSTIFNNYFLPDELPDLMDTSVHEKETYSIKKGDIFLTRTSETIDELAMSCVALKNYPDASFSGFTKRLRPKTQGIAYHKYLGFYLRGYLFRQAVTNHSIMTLRSSFNEEIFALLKLYLPDYEQQVKMGDFLYAIDRKIQLNNSINVELEKVAKMLYDYWFVQFDFPNAEGKPYRASGGEMEYNEVLKREIPEGWKVEKLDSLGDIVGGSTPSKVKPEYYTECGIAWITPKDLAINKNKFVAHGADDITELGLRSSNARLMPRGAVLFSSRAPIGYIAIASNEISTNQGFKSIIPKRSVGTAFVYFFLKDNLHIIKGMASGTTFKEISGATMKTIPAMIPDTHVLNYFNKACAPIFGKQELLEQENNHLVSLRDFLLPLLMNGQVTVTEAGEECRSLKKSSNASSSAFGWEFQSNAAIMLMLKNIERASKVKVEGSTEDIEITFTDGRMLMSQAKAVIDPEDHHHVKEKLIAGLQTLDNAAKLPNVEQLVFVTNSPNPFNDVTSMYKFSSPLNTVPFVELPAVCRKIITDICASKGYNFDTALLTVCVMQFHGENLDERYKVLSTLTTEFLNSLNVHKLSTKELLSLWQHSFSVNASQVTSSISKKQMVWPVIAIFCEIGEDDAALREYDNSDVTEILEKYKSIINNNSECFKFISRVLSDYNEFHPEMNSKERTEKFIAANCTNYNDCFDLKSADTATQEIVTRLTINNVLRSRKVITEIKGKLKL
jgi:type I restriction enzyme S subunit